MDAAGSLGFSVRGAKPTLVLNEGKIRCVVEAAEGDGGGFEVSESRDKEGEAAEDAMGGKWIKLSQRVL
ncbi:hypothetical protein Bca4012_071411 [Brassica carinata]